MLPLESSLICSPGKPGVYKLIKMIAAEKAAVMSGKDIRKLIQDTNKENHRFVRLVAIIIWNREDRDEIFDWAAENGYDVAEYRDIPQVI